MTQQKQPDQTPDETPVPENHSGDNVRASWPFSLHQIRSNIAHCSPQAKEVMVSAFLWCTEAKHPIHRNEFARRVKYSANVIYKVYSGKYRNSDGVQLDIPEKLISATVNFLRLEKERSLGDRNEFVLTPTAKRIHTACDLARESQTPVFIVGRSQIGKTWALEAYAEEKNHGATPYIRMKAASGLGGMARRIAVKLGISPDSNTANLIDYIKNALTKDMLPIFDELHLLMYTYRRSSFFACLEVLREIIDEVGCGAVFCGTQLLMDKIRAGEKGEMEQLLKRGVHRVVLPNMATKKDLTAILEKWGLPFPKKGEIVSVQSIDDEPYAVLRNLAKHNGLKAITERMRYAGKIAQKSKAQLTWEHFLEAHLTIESESQPEEDW